MRRSLWLTMLVLAGCQIAPAEPPPSETSGYFPGTLFERRVNCDFGLRPRPVLSGFEDEWYSEHLRAAGERPLSFAPGSPDALRFTWLRSFHAPTIVRVDWAPTGEATLTATMLSGAGGYEPGEVAETVSRSLTPDEVQRVLALRRAALREPAVDCVSMLDGARWVVEAVRPDGYHFVSAQSPEKGPVRDLGMAMLSFTGWDVGPTY